MFIKCLICSRWLDYQLEWNVSPSCLLVGNHLSFLFFYSSFLKSINFIEQFKSFYLFIFLVFTTTFRLLYFPTIFRCRLHLVAFLECLMEVFISSIFNLSSMLPFQRNFITSFYYNLFLLWHLFWAGVYF